jgi:hypothetical protein
VRTAGLLVDAEGKVVRAGSKGILSEDTPFWAQALGARKELDTGAVLQLLENERREDLSGRPLTWQVVRMRAAHPEERVGRGQPQQPRQERAQGPMLTRS